jgi:hypothetical protein
MENPITHNELGPSYWSHLDETKVYHFLFIDSHYYFADFKPSRFRNSLCYVAGGEFASLPG